jgi:hypothetical protein
MLHHSVYAAPLTVCYTTNCMLHHSLYATPLIVYTSTIQGNDAVSGKVCIVPYSILEKLVDNGRIRPEQV